MTESIRFWWRSNGGVIIVLVIQALLIVVWGAKLDSRVSTIEQRGSPQVDAIEHRMTLVEANHVAIVTFLNDNARKLDAIVSELHKHELETRK